DHTIWFDRIFSGAEQEVIISGTWRTLGFGLPAAISAKLARPERQVVAVVGDGGFAQVLAEFLTAVRYQVPITVIVVNNGYLAMEKDRMEKQEMPVEVTGLTNPDFAKFAEICGGKGFKVGHPDELENVLKSAFQSQTPNIVEVITGSPKFPGVK
ncbi:MAG TPA: thiamine pyrophosphate-dependent enzyme, partial [Bacillota bacterium]|nr:thiamine pyrophosphate-dependent enzyme [Bacillota bacterium]